MTVVTQFITEDGTEQGDLAEIRRLYVQNNNVIANSKVIETNSFYQVTFWQSFKKLQTELNFESSSK